MKQLSLWAVGFYLISAIVVVYVFSQQPGYTDSFYHYNGAVSLASGDGFVDDYLWVYIGAPDYLPAPSHLYWMPGTSIVSAIGMILFGQSYVASQIGLVIALWMAVLLAHSVGLENGSKRLAWFGGLSVLAGGFFLRFWGQTDTFAIYAAVGSLCLYMLGKAIHNHDWRWWLGAGICAGLGHLTRTDGLILVLVTCALVLYPWEWRSTWQMRLIGIIVFMGAYLVVMAPWFLRNMAVIGSPLAAGGMQGAWFTQYNDLFNYPADASPQTLFADGGALFLQTRLDALFSNQGIIANFVAVEANIVFAPFIIIGLWKRRKEAFWRPVWIFAIGIHLAFGLVFPFPGIRGGLFHAVAALVPMWAILGYLGMEDAIIWVSKRRRNWNPRLATPILSMGAFLIVIALSLSIAIPARFKHVETSIYHTLAEQLPSDARVMINDPSEFYYYTGLVGVPIPNEIPSVAREIAELYQIDYLILESKGIPDPMIFETPPSFLHPIETPIEGMSIYAFASN